jgi:hypothetical protein
MLRLFQIFFAGFLLLICFVLVVGMMDPVFFENPLVFSICILAALVFALGMFVSGLIIIWNARKALDELLPKNRLKRAMDEARQRIREYESNN